MNKPNILLITTDQQHYSTLGIINRRIKTPALDRLSNEGMRFERAYCPNPTCSPTRASIITGMYPSWHQCWSIGVKLHEDVPTIGDILQDSGYMTGLIGKAHFQPLKSEPGSESIECQPILRDLEFWRQFHGPWYGFQHVETARMHGNESHVGQHYALWLEEKGLKNWKDYFQEWPSSPHDKYKGPYYTRDSQSWDLPEEYHHSHWIGDRTIANLERCIGEGKPFFLWASFFDPHPPYTLPEPWFSIYDPDEMEPYRHNPDELENMPPQFKKTQEESPDFSEYAEPGGRGLHGFHSHLHSLEEMRRSIACYYGMISLVDYEIGRILDALDRLGVAEQTLIVFTTDHGHFLGQHGLIAKGAFHYEDLLRIPMIVRFPGRVPSGQVSQSIQSLVDLAPTWLTFAGIPIPGQMQGVNQLDVWFGDQKMVRDHALIENRHNPTTVHLRTYVNDQYKITLYRNADYGELFDLYNDPEEHVNLWSDTQYQEIKTKLLLRFAQAEMQREPTRMPRITSA